MFNQEWQPHSFFVRSQLCFLSSTTLAEMWRVSHLYLHIFYPFYENSFTFWAQECDGWEMGRPAPKVSKKASLKVKVGKSPDGELRRERGRVPGLVCMAM